MIFYSLIAGSYCIASGIHSYIRYKNILNNNLDGQSQLSIIPGKVSAVEFIGYKNSVNFPVYLEPSNSGINVPVGGGSSTEEIKLFSKIGDDYSSYTNYEIINKNGKSKYINFSKTLIDELSKHNISDTRFPISLPIKMIEYKFENGLYLLDKLASSNHKTLAYTYAFRKRYPLTFITLFCLVIPLALFDYDRYKRLNKH
jgi:hypothetical protein